MNSASTARPTVAGIDLDALGFNYRSIRDFVGEIVGIMAVVKANAYGHGAAACASRLEAEGVDWFAVATLEEGVELRQAGITKPVLLLGGLWPGQEIAAINFDLTPVIFRLDQANAIAEAALRQDSIARVHVKIDTGMGRVGFRSDEIGQVAEGLAGIDNLKVEGVMTHFAVGDDPDATHFTEYQIASFNAAVQQFLEHGHRPTYVDMANSPGAIVHPLSRLKLVRIGGLLYGLGGDVLPAGVPQPELRPVMSISSKIAQIKTILPNELVGYGRTFVAARDTTVATVPIGYHDGLPRALSNKGHLLVKGRRAPIIGRVSMDWTTIDVTGITDVRVGDDVTIIGRSGDEVIRAETLAAETETISYEITCGIGQRIPRIYNSL